MQKKTEVTFYSDEVLAIADASFHPHEQEEGRPDHLSAVHLISSAKIQLSRLKNISEELPEERDLLASAFAVIDTLVVIPASVEGIHEHSIGYFAKGDKIDEEWEK